MCKEKKLQRLSRSPYGTWTCRFCKRIFESKNKLYHHYHECHNDKLFGPHGKGQCAWNKGLSKDSDSRLMKISQTKRRRYLNGETKPSFLGKHHNENTKRKISDAQRHLVYQRVCKKTVSYVKKDGTIVKMDSSYEIRLAKILDELDISWSRPNPMEWYDKNGKMHHYYPDFLLEKYNLFLDPKNEYCFKVQSEKIEYIIKHYPNVIFMHNEQITKQFIIDLCINQKRFFGQMV